jgi:hypothetical protein
MLSFIDRSPFESLSRDVSAAFRNPLLFCHLCWSWARPIVSSHSRTRLMVTAAGPLAASMCQAVEPDELGCDLGEVLVSPLRPAILNRDGAAFDPAEFAQPLHKSGNPPVHGYRRARAQEPDGRQLCRLLRARREWLGCRRAAEQRDEVAPSHGLPPEAEGRTLPHRCVRTLVCITAKLCVLWRPERGGQKRYIACAR